MDECLYGLYHIASVGAGIQQDCGHGGSILQVCCLHCNEDSLRHRRSCKVFFQTPSGVLGFSFEHCVG